LGWGVENDPLYGTILAHEGSDGVDLASVWISPGSNFAVLFTTNTCGNLAPDSITGNPAAEASTDVINTLIAKFYPF